MSQAAINTSGAEEDLSLESGRCSCDGGELCVAIDQLAIEIDELPLTLDPGNLFDYTSRMIASALYDTLSSDRSGPCEAAPALAEDISTIDDGRTWKIVLRADQLWSDGSPVVAADLERAIRRQADPDRLTAQRWLCDIVDGVAAARGSGSSSAPISGCRSLDERTVLLRMTRPIAYAPLLLAHPCFAPRWEGADADASMGAGDGVTSGPYRIGGWFPDRRGIILEANQGTRRCSPLSPRRLVFVRTDGPDQGIRLYGYGKIDLTCHTTFPPMALPRLAAAPDLALPGLTMVAQLQSSIPGIDPNVRATLHRAISHAIDRAAIASRLNGAIAPLWRYTEAWFPDDGAMVPCDDPKRARALFRSIAPHELPRPLRLGYADFSPNGEVVELIAEQLRSSIGIAIETEPLSYADYIGQLGSGSFDLLYTLVPAPYNDPSSLLAPFRRGGILAAGTGFADERFDWELSRAEGEFDLEARIEGYRRANDYLLGALPVIPLFRVIGAHLRRPSLHGFSMPLSGIAAFERIHAHRGADPVREIPWNEFGSHS